MDINDGFPVSDTPALATVTLTFTLRLDVDIRQPGNGHSIASVVANLVTEALANDVPLQRVLAHSVVRPNVSIEAPR